jgi:1-deoxy-D-xylulose-5-phosphate reductoisomerase
MTKKIILLGSTGSIGESTLNAINKKKTKFKIKLLTTNRNVKKIYKQAIKYNVKKIVINDIIIKVYLIKKK